jgi:hypothetical protein
MLWLRPEDLRRLPAAGSPANVYVTEERTQVDTYLSCVILAESVGSLWGNFVRDYLVEQYENMLSFRTLNAYYPRLSFGRGSASPRRGVYRAFRGCRGDFAGQGRRLDRSRERRVPLVPSALKFRSRAVSPRGQHGLQPA